MDVRLISSAGYQLWDSIIEVESSDCILVVWNGTGMSDTDGDWAHSGYGTESAVAKYSGTYGLDATSFTKDLKIYFEDVAPNHIIYQNTLSMYLNIKEWQSNKDIRIYFNMGGQVDLSDYLKTYNINVWQNILIPLEDFNISLPVNLKKLTFESKGAMGLYLDNINLVIGYEIVERVPVNKPKLDADYINDNYRPVIRAYK